MNRNKALAVLGMTMATSIALAGCSSAGSSDTGEVSGNLSIEWDATFQDALAPAVAEFQSRYPDVNVKVDYVGGADLLSTVSTQAQSGTLPDVFPAVPGPKDGPAFAVGVLANQGYLADLSDTDWAGKIPDGLKGSVSLDGKVYAYPGALQGLGTIYNTTLMDQLGLKIPTTWDDLIKLCADAKTKGVYALSNGQGGDGSSAQMPYIDMIGSLGTGPDPSLREAGHDGTLQFADSPWAEVWAKYAELGENGCFGEGSVGRDRSQALSELAAGKALAMVDVGAQVGALAEQAPNSQFTLMPLPASDKPYFSAAPGYILSVPAQGNVTAAKAFLEILGQPEFLNGYVEKFGGVPVIPNDEFKPTADLEPLVDAVASGDVTDYSDTGLIGPVNTVAQQETQKLLLGNYTVDQVLAALQTEADNNKK